MDWGQRISAGTRTFVAARLCALAGLALPLCAAADEPLTVESQITVSPAEGVKEEAGGVNYVVAPIPISNPTIGTGLAVTGMILYDVDPRSPVSFTALGGGYTSSDSWLVAGAEKLNFDADNYRATAAVGLGQLNYNFFGIGSSDSGRSIPLDQRAFAWLLDFRRRVFGSMHLGLRWVYGDVKTAIPVKTGTGDPTIDQRELDTTLSGLGVVGDWDSRDQAFSPKRGTYVELTSNFPRTAFGSDRNFQTYSLAWNYYHELGEPNVLATRLYLCSVSHSTPFFLTCAFGASRDLRGYEAGRYRDVNEIAVQTEYRMMLWRRFGGVVFAGVGSVANTFGNLFSSTALPSAGVGLRYLAVPTQGVMVSVDYAWGRAGSQGLYVYIGDSF